MESFVPSVITPYGYLHTFISVLSMAAGIWACIDGGRISGTRLSGKIFYAVTLIEILTGVTIFHHGGFGVGHVLSLIMLILLIAAVVASLRSVWISEVVASSLLYFLIWFFATTETLTRVPQDHPFATSPTDPNLVPVRGALFVFLIAGLTWQYRKFRLR